METKDENVELIMQYLLGELAEEEQGQLEERFFADDVLYQEVRAVERELIDRYVLGKLTGRERARFERRFLSSPQRREKVALARSFRQGIAAVTAPGKQKVVAATPRPETRQEAARPTLHDRFVGVVHWLSPLCQPLLAGEPATAADTPTQEYSFYLEEGTIRLTLAWWAATPGQPAALRIAWHVDTPTAADFWVRFTRREDPTVVLGQVPLGSAAAGEEVFSAQELGFDPTREPWAFIVLQREPEG
jgi:anti-sigma factor RsiW